MLPGCKIWSQKWQSIKLQRKKALQCAEKHFMLWASGLVKTLNLYCTKTRFKLHWKTAEFNRQYFHMSKIKQIKRYIVKSLFIPLGPAWVISFFLGKTVSFLFFLPEFLHTNRANKTTQSISPLYTESTLYKVLHLTLFLFNCSDFPMISHVNIILPIPFQLHNVPLYYGIIINLSTIYGHLSFCSTLLQYIVLVDLYEKKSNLTHI